MAQPGPKPKPEDQRRNQNRPTHDWVTVPDIPYAGAAPNPGRLPARTKQWWAAIVRMPHCVLWTESDWQFAIDTAWVHATWAKTHAAGQAAELRIREKTMGTTADARRDLRIRYVPQTDEGEVVERPISLAERRRELEG